MKDYKYYDELNYRISKLNSYYQKWVADECDGGDYFTPSDAFIEEIIAKAEDMQHTEELMEKYEAKKWVSYDEYNTIKYTIKNGIHYPSKPIYLVSDLF